MENPLYMYCTCTLYNMCVLTCVFISYSVNQLAEVLRCAIEQEAKILYELKVPGVNFKINQVHTTHHYDNCS